MCGKVSSGERSRTGLLSSTDPAPVEVINATGTAPYFLTCEHAGRTIPESLERLGLDERHLERHISWDIGADGLARLMAEALDAPLVLQRYSRLVIDCNRPLHADDSIPQVSDGTTVPGNVGLEQAHRFQRTEEIHTPYHDAVTALLNERARAKKPTALVAVHSFTPCLEAAPAPRPWDLGLLHNRHESLSRHVHDVLEVEANHLNFAFNEPYTVSDLEDFTIPVHGEQRGIPNMLLEVRNDHISHAAGQSEWARLLGRVLDLVSSRL